MTKTIFLLRHARAAPAVSSGADMDRPLTPEGIERAEELGKIIRAENLTPDLVLCSPARRTRETLEFIGRNVPNLRVSFHEEIYKGGQDAVWFLLRGLAPDIGKVLVIGHNPGIEVTAVGLAAGNAQDDIRRALHAGYAPGTLTGILADVETWQELSPPKCRAFLLKACP